MILTNDTRDYGLAGLSLIIVGGVIRAFMKRTRGDNGQSERLQALEVKLSKTAEGVVQAEARVVDLEHLIEERSSALDQKMEIMLDEMKESRLANDQRHAESRADWAKMWGSFNEAYRLVSERLARMETNIGNLKEQIDRPRNRGT